MTDTDLIEALGELGLDATNFRLVALLPLVEVAWVDREIQPAERDLILHAARAQGVEEGPAREILDRWLASRPDDRTFARAREILAALVQRPDASGVALPKGSADAILDLCEHVASAAGGLWGVAFTVSAEERQAIRRIATALGKWSAQSSSSLR